MPQFSLRHYQKKGFGEKNQKKHRPQVIIFMWILTEFFYGGHENHTHILISE